MITKEEALVRYGKFNPIKAERFVNEMAINNCNGDFELALSEYATIPDFHAWIIYSLEEGREILSVYEEPWF